MKPHLLFIAFWYPPSRASGVYRALATTRAFVDAGWDVTVITSTKEFLEDEIGSIDESLLDLIPPSVELTRVPFSLGLPADLDVRSLGWWKASFPSAWRKFDSSLDPMRGALSVMKGASPEAHRMRDNYVGWIDPVVKAGLTVHSEKRVDHILATGNPFSAFEAARLLAELTETPFSVDYRDPWSMDVFTGNMDYADRATTEAERLIIAESTFCFHVNPAIADAYRAKFPESQAKQLVVYNGYDEESIPEPPTRSEGPIRFGILGTLNDRWPLEPTFEGWSLARADLPPRSTLVLGGHLGYFARSRDLLETYLPDRSAGFEYLGPVPKAQVAEFYATLDVVVLPVPGGPMVTTGKVYEALAIGVPMVCVQSKGGGARELIEDEKLGFGAEPEAEAVRAALLDAARASQNLDPALVSAARENARRFERRTAMDEMVMAVSALGAGRQTA
ncbi:MAG TPA: glycosyltransferase [Acidimicrobiia bacterium]|nr:glycosyltransferase [Acidimicrobiia bacterium]